MRKVALCADPHDQISVTDGRSGDLRRTYDPDTGDVKCLTATIS